MPPQGGWCSFWLSQPHEITAEIDIAGWGFGDRHRIIANMFNADRVSHEHWSQTAFDVTDGFHVYACDWEPGRIVYYIDGAEWSRTEGTTPADELLVNFNFACGGWGGAPSAPFPATWAIDYCRVYRQDGTLSGPPVIAAITASLIRPAVQEPISFAAVVTNGQEAVDTYAWSFGDGATGQGPSPTHAYAAPGRFTVTLLVSDAAGHTANRMVDVSIAAAK
jgi:beta-glucanase (GH16 family)